MKTITIKTFRASINLGLKKGYSQETISEKEVINFLQAFQEKMIVEENIYLSASIINNMIVLSGQAEPHLKIEFINYPRFFYKESLLKEKINELAELLLNKFEQNRIVIIYDDKTVMIEQSDEIDPQITLG